METKSKKAKAKSAARKAERIAAGELLAQWTSLAAKADGQRLSEDELLTLMTQGRSGDLNVKTKLIEGTAYLVYEAGFTWTSASSRRRFEDIFCPLSVGHDEEIDNLLNNERTDIIKAVSDELRRRIRDFMREESPTIYVKPSTKSRRKKLGLREYHDLKRSGAHLADNYVEGETFALPDGTDHKAPFTEQRGRRYVPPSKYHTEHDDFAIVELLDEFTDERLQLIAAMLFEEKTQAQIVEAAGTTEYAVAKAVAAIKEKLGPYWGQSDDAVKSVPGSDTCPMLSTLPEKWDEATVASTDLELCLSV